MISMASSNTDSESIISRACNDDISGSEQGGDISMSFINNASDSRDESSMSWEPNDSEDPNESGSDYDYETDYSTISRDPLSWSQI